MFEYRDKQGNKVLGNERHVIVVVVGNILDARQESMIVMAGVTSSLDRNEAIRISELLKEKENGKENESSPSTRAGRLRSVDGGSGRQGEGQEQARHAQAEADEHRLRREAKVDEPYLLKGLQHEKVGEGVPTVDGIPASSLERTRPDAKL